VQLYHACADFTSVIDCLILTSSVEGGEAVCPGEVTLTCTVTGGISLVCISEPYISLLHAVTFTSTEWLRVGVPVHRDPFQIVLRNITSNSSQTSLTSILSFIATSTLNGNVVECDSDSMTARITLHIAGSYILQASFCNSEVNAWIVQRSSYISITEKQR